MVHIQTDFPLRAARYNGRNGDGSANGHEAPHEAREASISEFECRTPFDPQCGKDESLKLPRNACHSVTRFQSLSYLQDLLGVGNDRDLSPRERVTRALISSLGSC
jgi:hypothetical protein